MSDRTVLDVIGVACFDIPHIDPDMPFDQFQRWLHYGRRADKLAPYGGELRSDHTDTWDGGWNTCLHAIKGTP